MEEQRPRSSALLPWVCWDWGMQCVMRDRGLREHQFATFCMHRGFLGTVATYLQEKPQLHLLQLALGVLSFQSSLLFPALPSPPWLAVDKNPSTSHAWGSSSGISQPEIGAFGAKIPRALPGTRHPPGYLCGSPCAGAAGSKRPSAEARLSLQCK